MLGLLSATLLALASSQSTNPYEGSQYYIQQSYVSEVQSSINAHPSDATLLKGAQYVPVFYWIDSMSRIENLTTVMEGAAAQAKNTSKKVVVEIIVYDVPDRDCAAAASNGEIVCEDDACAQGIQTYKTQYIDPIITILKKYPTLNIVALVEPDSLPNLATNMAMPKCAQAKTAYETAIPYAIQQLGTISNVYQYIDAAHGGWLGWPDNMSAFVQIIRQVLQTAGNPSNVRGFASNTANYQPLESVTSTSDPCELQKNYNKCINEAIYIQYMSQEMNSGGVTGMHYITDTSRNGVPDARENMNENQGPCSEWCNINHAGFHYKPTSDTSSTGIPDLIDAFVWAKVPGESDGTSNTSASNYDYHCGSDESVIPSPQAGQWFDSFFLMLAQNANPPLSGEKYTIDY